MYCVLLAPIFWQSFASSRAAFGTIINLLIFIMKLDYNVHYLLNVFLNLCWRCYCRIVTSSRLENIASLIFFSWWTTYVFNIIGCCTGFGTFLIVVRYSVTRLLTLSPHLPSAESLSNVGTPMVIMDGFDVIGVTSMYRNIRPKIARQACFVYSIID